MRKAIIILLSLIFCLIGTTTFAAIWNVPKDFATIQEAIDSPDVTDGDTIRVSPGNHFGAFINKSVTIKGKGNANIDKDRITRCL